MTWPFMVAPFVLAAALASFGLLGTRIVLFHLFIVAIVTWALRRGLSESARWKEAAATTRQNVGALFSGRALRALVWTATIYLFWNLAAGTAGLFNPYIIETLGAGGPVASVLLSCSGFVIAMLTLALVFMRYADGGYRTRRWLWGIGAIVQIAAYGMLIFLPFSIPVVLANILLFAAGSSLAGEAFYKVFSQELFPTMLRSTAQGITFGVARVILGIWSFFVPLLAAKSISQLAGLLTVFLVISGVVGFFFMPDTSGKSLEQIERERA